MAGALADMAKAPILTQMNSFITEIDSSITLIKGTTNPDEGLITKYGSLKKAIEDTINGATSVDITALTASLQAHQNAKLDLDKEKATFMFKAKPNAYTLSDFAKMTLGKTLDTVLLCIFCLVVVLGGTIASHYVIDKPLAYRLYYFVYGAALFPFSLAYGAVSPTYWRSTIFPLFEKGSEGSILTSFPLSFFWSFFAFSPPTPRDTETIGYTRLLMRIFSGGSLVAFVAAYFLRYQKLPV